MILPVNAMLAAGVLHAEPDGVTQLVRLFLEGSGYALFAFLFGWGFARKLATAGSSKHRFRRRLVVLAGIGLAHGLLVWPGDILLPYAVIGFALLAFRDVAPGRLLVMGCIAIAIPPALLALTSALRSGLIEPSALAIGPLRVRDLLQHYSAATTYGWTIFGCMLAGIVASDLQLLERGRSSKPLLNQLFVVGVGTGLPLSLATLVWDLSHLHSIGAVLMATGYVGLIARFSGSTGRGVIVAGLTAAGRLPLSNYVLQTSLLTILAMAAWLPTGTSSLMVLCVIIISVQMAVSSLVIGRYGTGPLEAIWRRIADPPVAARDTEIPAR